MDTFDPDHLNDLIHFQPWYVYNYVYIIMDMEDHKMSKPIVEHR